MHACMYLCAYLFVFLHPREQTFYLKYEAAHIQTIKAKFKPILILRTGIYALPQM